MTENTHKIYVASSWRNNYQPDVVNELMIAGHEVYDFKNPHDVNPLELNPQKTKGFSWSEITDKIYDSFGVYKETLDHPIAAAGYKKDMDAMLWADVCVLVLPCGRSAHLEAGWFAGMGKPCLVYFPEYDEPELMVKMCNLITEDFSDVIGWLNEYPSQDRRLPAIEAVQDICDKWERMPAVVDDDFPRAKYYLEGAIRRAASLLGMR